MHVLIHAASIPQSSSPVPLFQHKQGQDKCCRPAADRFPRRESVWLIQRSRTNVSIPALTDSLEPLPANTSFMLPVSSLADTSVQIHRRMDGYTNTTKRFTRPKNTDSKRFYSAEIKRLNPSYISDGRMERFKTILTKNKIFGTLINVLI